MDVDEDLESNPAGYISMCVLRRLCEYAMSSKVSCAGQSMTFLLSVSQKPPIIAHSVVPSGTRGLKFGLSLHNIILLYIHTLRKRTAKALANMRICASSHEPSVLDDKIKNKV